MDFPGGTVVKNLSAREGDMGLIPGPGCSHMPQSNWACVPQLLSPRATTTEPVCHNYSSPRTLEPKHCNYWANALQLLKPAHSRAYVSQLLSLRAATTEAHAAKAHALHQEKPLQWEARTPQRRVTLARCN